MTKYGLRNKKTKKLVGFTVDSNEGSDFAIGTQYSLSEGEDNFWLVDYAQHAEWVRLNSTPWYNAGYDTPSNYFKPEDFEVVKVNITEEKVNVKIPTDLQILEILYKEKEPAHFENLKKEIEKGKPLQLDFHRYKQALGKNIYRDGGILNKKVTFKQLFQ